jgi:hypothetical protein
MSKYEIKINLDRKCVRCGKGGATESGICLGCVAKAVKNGELDHIFKKSR